MHRVLLGMRTYSIVTPMQFVGLVADCYPFFMRPGSLYSAFLDAESKSLDVFGGGKGGSGDGSSDEEEEDEDEGGGGSGGAGNGQALGGGVRVVGKQAAGADDGSAAVD